MQRPLSSHVLKIGIHVLGLALLGLGVVGLYTPGLPGTVFLVLALACFSHSSPKMESWMLNHRLMGATLRTWRDTGSIPIRIKWIAVSCIVLFSVYSILGSPPWAQVVVGALMTFGVWFVLSRPTTESIAAGGRSAALISPPHNPHR